MTLFLSPLHLSRAVLATSEMSVSPSVKRVNSDKMKETCANIKTTWKIIHPSFLPRKMVGGRQPLVPEILGQTNPFRAKMPIFNWYLVIVKKNSINTNRKPTTCFPMSLRWTSSVARKPPNRAQNAKPPFVRKTALHLKKVCYKVSLCECCQQQSCNAFTVLSIHAKMVCGGRPLLRLNLPETDHPLEKHADFQSIFARSASAITLREKSSIITNYCTFQWP